MARKRLIDTEEFYFDSELVALLGNRGLHLYIRLWGLAEDWGGYEPKYEDIALKMGALRFKAKEAKNYIDNLIEKKKIVEYEVGEKKIHWIVNLLKHQPLDNPAPPKLSLPEWISCELCEYKSGKKYAKYKIIPEKLPVVYQSATRNSVTVTKRNSNVTKRNSNKIQQPSAANAALKKVFDAGFNIYPLLYKLKKELGWAKDRNFPEEVIKGVADAYFRDKAKIKEHWPWLVKVIKAETEQYYVNKNITEHKAEKQSGVLSFGEILKRAETNK